MSHFVGWSNFGRKFWYGWNHGYQSNEQEEEGIGRAMNKKGCKFWIVKKLSGFSDFTIGRKSWCQWYCCCIKLRKFDCYGYTKNFLWLRSVNSKALSSCIYGDSYLYGWKVCTALIKRAESKECFSTCSKHRFVFFHETAPFICFNKPQELSFDSYTEPKSQTIYAKTRRNCSIVWTLLSN